MKLTLEGDVRLRGSESAQHVAPKIALLSARWWDKGCAVQNPSPRILRTMQLQRHAGDYIWARVKRDPVSECDSANHVHWRSGSREDETVHAPPAQRGVGNAVPSGTR